MRTREPRGGGAFFRGACLRKEWIFSYSLLLVLPSPSPPWTGRVREQEDPSTTTATPWPEKEVEALLGGSTIAHQTVRPTRQIDLIRLILVLPADTTRPLKIPETVIWVREDSV